MSKKINEGVTDFIIKKMIGLIAGGIGIAVGLGALNKHILF